MITSVQEQPIIDSIQTEIKKLTKTLFNKALYQFIRVSVMKYQSGLGGEVEENIGIDAEKEDTDYGDDQGNF
jgi:hypothetical protein